MDFNGINDEDDHLLQTGKYFNELLTLSAEDLKCHRSMKDAYAKTMQYLINVIGNCLSQMDMDGWQLEIVTWPSDNDVDNEVIAALKQADP
eukprot:14311005-Ditylum_brightwellii.AAC.1